MKFKFSAICLAALLCTSGLALGERSYAPTQDLDAPGVIPFAIAKEGVDTGIAVANTGWADTNLTFSLYINQGGGMVEIAVDLYDLDAVGMGLDSGFLPPGGTYSILMSELAQAAGLTEYVGLLRVYAENSEVQVVDRFLEAGSGDLLDASACELAGLFAAAADPQCGCDPTESCPQYSTVSDCLTCTTQDCQTEVSCSCTCRYATGEHAGTIDGRCVITYTREKIESVQGANDGN